MRLRIGWVLVATVVISVIAVASAPRVAAEDLEQRLAAFWTRINALAPTDPVSSADLGQWALFVIEREPRARLTVTDFRSVTASMQSALDRAGLAPSAPTPAPTPTPTPIVGVIFEMNDVQSTIRSQWVEDNTDTIETLECERTDAVAAPATIKCGYITDTDAGSGYIRVQLKTDGTWTWATDSDGWWMAGIMRLIRIQYGYPWLTSLSCGRTGFVDATSTLTDSCAYTDGSTESGTIRLTLRTDTWSWEAP